MHEMASNNNDEASPFSEYMWMGDMEKFDLELEAKMEEEEFIRSCIEQLLDEEEERETIFFSQSGPLASLIPAVGNGITQQQNSAYIHSIPRYNLYMNGHADDKACLPNMKAPSALNPNAAPFVLNPNAKEFIPMTAPPSGQEETAPLPRSSSSNPMLSTASSS